MLVAFDFALGPVSTIGIAADPGDSFLREALREIDLRFLPNKIIMLYGDDPRYPRVGGKPAVYVCRNSVCQLPVTDIAELRKLLDRER